MKTVCLFVRLRGWAAYTSWMVSATVWWITSCRRISATSWAMATTPVAAVTTAANIHVRL